MSSRDFLSPTGEAGALPERPRSMWRDALRRLGRNRPAVACAGLVLLLVFLAVTAPWIAPYNPVEMHADDAFSGPSSRYLLGTDEYGRDLLSRIIYGSRTSLAVGIISVSISLLSGTLLGLVAGYYLGFLDIVISRVMDVLYAYPPILLALVAMAILGTGMEKAMVAIGIVYIPLFARVCRGSVIAERGKVYVEAARMVGAGNLRIIIRHVLPNVLAPIIVQASLCVSYAILAEAALSYLGLGTQPPMPSWGMMLAKGRGLMSHSPWVSVWPGVSIMLAVFAFNVFGDGLRDALDPRLIGT